MTDITKCYIIIVADKLRMRIGSKEVINLRICDICYAVLQEKDEDDVCAICKERKTVKELMEKDFFKQDDIVKRYVDLIDLRAENLKKLKNKTEEIKI